ncbi:M48 family metallopeptidase [Bacteroidia bacterium]|nr:M48 family metallopeptidase [Bacteroidia bacterium]MDB9881766.1 M48 family metallopeptidase [Bacteroidia bacterium]MDC1395532.1 M48 family metallopeptidase [Bacteroidia bacterium]
MKKIITLKRYIVIGLLAVMIWGCSKVPLTGRRQFKLLPESTLIQASSLSYQQVLDTANIIRTGEQAAMVKRVGLRISKAVEAYLTEQGLEKRVEGFDWQFNLINDNNVNAWCMSGGKVAFYTGITPICQDETGVAVVMGHEIAHAIARHGNERVSQSLALQGMATGLDLAMLIKEKLEVARQVVNTAVGIGGQLGMLAFSRKHESESDELGLTFMAMAGYNPSEAPKFWDRMSQIGGERPPVMLSTHPDSGKRQEDLQKLLPKAMVIYNQNKR